ncbi:MAG: hypothetical protein JEY97_04860 [Bacteroidales bacterium]|nr:hypothetical protein [Bacteroidales bacterium]
MSKYDKKGEYQKFSEALENYAESLNLKFDIFADKAKGGSASIINKQGFEPPKIVI